jgi:hypothetical protein
MIEGLDEGTRALLAQRLKRLHDEAGDHEDPALSEAYRVLSFGMEVLILMGPQSVSRTIRGTGDWGDAAHALFDDLWN